jgi:hypothetical protein
LYKLPLLAHGSSKPDEFPRTPDLALGFINIAPMTAIAGAWKIRCNRDGILGFVLTGRVYVSLDDQLRCTLATDGFLY